MHFLLYSHCILTFIFSKFFNFKENKKKQKKPNKQINEIKMLSKDQILPKVKKFANFNFFSDNLLNRNSEVLK